MVRCWIAAQLKPSYATSSLNCRCPADAPCGHIRVCHTLNQELHSRNKYLCFSPTSYFLQDQFSALVPYLAMQAVLPAQRGQHCELQRAGLWTCFQHSLCLLCLGRGCVGTGARLVTVGERGVGVGCSVPPPPLGSCSTL